MQKSVREGQTNEQTDGWTDKPTYRHCGLQTRPKIEHIDNQTYIGRDEQQDELVKSYEKENVIGEQAESMILETALRCKGVSIFQ